MKNIGNSIKCKVFMIFHSWKSNGPKIWKTKTEKLDKSFPTNQIAKFNNRQLYYLIFILDLGNLLFSTLFSKSSKGWENIRIYKSFLFVVIYEVCYPLARLWIILTACTCTNIK